MRNRAVLGRDWARDCVLVLRVRLEPKSATSGNLASITGLTCSTQTSCRSMCEKILSRDDLHNHSYHGRDKNSPQRGVKGGERLTRSANICSVNRIIISHGNGHPWKVVARSTETERGHWDYRVDVTSGSLVETWDGTLVKFRDSQITILSLPCGRRPASPRNLLAMSNY